MWSTIMLSCLSGVHSYGLALDSAVTGKHNRRSPTTDSEGAGAGVDDGVGAGGARAVRHAYVNDDYGQAGGGDGGDNSESTPPALSPMNAPTQPTTVRTTTRRPKYVNLQEQSGVYKVPMEGEEEQVPGIDV
jgi:hypothetical protein